MANLTAPRDPQRQQAVIYPYLAAAVDMFPGGLVSVNAARFAKKSSDTSGELFVGILDKAVKNSTGAAGAVDARVWKSGAYDFAITGAVQTDIGAVVYAVDDQTVAKSTTNSVIVGKICEVISATKVRVIITPQA